MSEYWRTSDKFRGDVSFFLQGLAWLTSVLLKVTNVLYTCQIHSHRYVNNKIQLMGGYEILTRINITDFCFNKQMGIHHYLESSEDSVKKVVISSQDLTQPNNQFSLLDSNYFE